MLGNSAIEALQGPLGLMLVGVLVVAALVWAAWGAGRRSSRNDALIELLKRERLAATTASGLPYERTKRGPRRAVRKPLRGQIEDRERQLQQVAAVLRGGERDDRLVRAARSYLAKEGMVMADPDTPVEAKTPTSATEASAETESKVA